MGRIIDLSREITASTPVFPGDDPVKLYQTRFLPEHYHNNHRLETGMHVGTHIDAPMHMTANNTRISDIELERLIGQGCVLTVEAKWKISYKKEYEESVIENGIVLVNTGFGRHYGMPEYFSNYPVLDLEFGHMLVRKKIKVLGLDTPSPDKFPFELHKLLLRHDILIAENLTNLDKMPPVGFEVFVVPLRISADGSPARVFARI